MKNYGDKKKTIKQVYHDIKVPNPDIKEVDNFVKVDLTIPGCPITGKEFMEIGYQLLAGRKPRISQNPVCYECQKLGYECLLQKGQICLGPITLGGCEAVCLKSKQACWGCRGLFEGAQVSNLMAYLLSKFTKKQVDRVMEVFGAKDTIMQEWSKEQKATKKVIKKKINVLPKADK